MNKQRKRISRERDRKREIWMEKEREGEKKNDGKKEEIFLNIF